MLQCSCTRKRDHCIGSGPSIWILTLALKMAQESMNYLGEDEGQKNLTGVLRRKIWGDKADLPMAEVEDEDTRILINVKVSC